jgi:hypothetical protein
MRRRLGLFDSLAGKRLAPREAFRHRVAAIPKPYPDSQLILEQRGMSRRLLETGQFLQLNIYTADFYDLPDDLFTHQEINWHNQQLGQKGLIAAAGLWIKDSTMIISTLQSDLCQQLYRHPVLRRSCKTRVETHFKYWYAILINAILDLCLEGGISVVYCPTGLQVIRETQKEIIADLFMRIYDHADATYLCSRVIRGTAEYWKISVEANSDRIARLVTDTKIAAGDEEGTRICVFHDIEENVDTNISAAECAYNLTKMLEIENELGVNATYNILGLLFRSKREEIQASNPRHSLAFHSFNHNLDDLGQLQQCRKVDLRVRGYRTPKSRITSELSDYALAYFNFEWLASSDSSLGHPDCKLKNGIVKIPIHQDDYPLAIKSVDYPRWEADLLDHAHTHTFFAFGLHDCYAREWLRHYPRLLGELSKIGRFVTADQLCNRIIRQASSDTLRQSSPTQVTRSLLLEG